VARIFTASRLLYAGLILLGIAAVLYLVPSGRYLVLPDRAQSVAPYVQVQGERDDDDGGGFYYVAVEIKKASILEKLFPWVYEGATLVPSSQVRAPGESDSEHRRAELRAMAQSQEIAAAVALKALGYDVAVHAPGTLILSVKRDGPSAGKLKPKDVVIAVDGRRPLSPADLRRLITRHRPGQTVQLKVRRGDRLLMFSVKTVADSEDPSRALIGVTTPSDCTTQSPSQVELPLRVHIDLGQVGGPSAGLAFALDIAEELGRDIDRGHKIAATGELCMDGTVGPVGGLKQKTIGAKEAGVDVFLVPAGDNAKVARRYAGNMRVVPVNSYRQALHELATLSKKERNS
jgi:PDZ domain-containing protein